MPSDERIASALEENGGNVPKRTPSGSRGSSTRG